MIKPTFTFNSDAPGACAYTPFGDLKDTIWTSPDTSETTYELTETEIDGDEDLVTHWSVIASFDRNGLHYEKALEDRPTALTAVMETGL